MLFDSLWHGIIMICPSGSFENVNDVLGMACACSAFVDEGSAIGTSLFVEKPDTVIGWFLCVCYFTARCVLHKGMRDSLHIKKHIMNVVTCFVV